MKNTLRLLAAAAVLAVAAPVYAQGGGGGGGGQQMSPEQRMAQQKERYFAGITLSPAQSAKADTILMQAMAKQREAMQAANGDRAAMMPAMTKIREEQAAALKGILSTDADKAKFDENVKNMPAGGRRGGV
jgi:regulator of protease activity HflC (stomatin/prohibitin superfamily)